MVPSKSLFGPHQMMLDSLLTEYLGGPGELHEAVRGMTSAHLTARPIPGQWSTLEVLCHLADAESVFADRVKRILAEDNPPLPFADPKLFAPALAYTQRDAEVELDMIDVTRRQLVTILAAVPADDLLRTGLHSTEGLVTARQVVEKAVRHLRHHATFILEKRKALGLS